MICSQVLKPLKDRASASEIRFISHPWKGCLRNLCNMPYLSPCAEDVRIFLTCSQTSFLFFSKCTVWLHAYWGWYNGSSGFDAICNHVGMIGCHLLPCYPTMLHVDFGREGYTIVWSSNLGRWVQGTPGWVVRPRVDFKGIQQALMGRLPWIFPFFGVNVIPSRRLVWWMAV